MGIRAMMFTPFRQRTLWLLAALGVSVLIVTSGCSAARGRQPINVVSATPSPIPINDNDRSTPSIPQSTSTRAFTHPPHLACDSKEFAVPEQVVMTGKKFDGSQRQDPFDERFAEQHGWLSVHLDLAQDVVPYAAPVPLLLTITNQSDHSVIFVRPRLISVGGTYDFNHSIRLFVDMRSSSGEKIGPPATLILSLYSSPPIEDFSMLPPGKSCTVSLQLLWNKTIQPLEQPIPPGDYQVKVSLLGLDLGPSINKDEALDIGSWVGKTDFSNTVTLNVLPPEK